MNVVLIGVGLILISFVIALGFRIYGIRTESPFTKFCLYSLILSFSSGVILALLGLAIL